MIFLSIYNSNLNTAKNYLGQIPFGVVMMLGVFWSYIGGSDFFFILSTCCSCPVAGFYCGCGLSVDAAVFWSYIGILLILQRVAR
jgi:hypothetical protein